MKAILKTNNLCKDFKKQKAVKNVSITVRENSIYGLLGPNGAGKSTTLKMITGMLRPTMVLCQEKVQIKCNQFSLCLAKLNLLFLSHYLVDFSDILPHIGLGINTRNGCEYVLYCKMFLCIQKSTYMHVYN